MQNNAYATGDIQANIKYILWIKKRWKKKQSKVAD